MFGERSGRWDHLLLKLSLAVAGNRQRLIACLASANISPGSARGSWLRVSAAAQRLFHFSQFSVKLGIIHVKRLLIQLFPLHFVAGKLA